MNWLKVKGLGEQTGSARLLWVNFDLVLRVEEFGLESEKRTGVVLVFENSRITVDENPDDLIERLYEEYEDE